MSRPTASTVYLAALACAVVGYTLLPSAGLRDLGYLGIAAVSMVVGLISLAARDATGRGSLAWTLLLAGYGLLLLGNVAATVQTDLLHDLGYRGPSNVTYLASYLFIGAGLVSIVRCRGARNLAAVLDAAILTVGVGVVTLVFVVSPVATNTSLSTSVKVISSAYPLGGVLLLGILALAWATPVTRQRSFRLVGLSLVLLLLGDSLSELSSSVDGLGAYSTLLWLSAYGLLPAAMLDATAPGLARPVAMPIEPADEGADPVVDPSRRLALLTAGLLLPAAALLGNGIWGRAVQWSTIGCGSVVLSCLVSMRMAGLLGAVRVQASRLAELASLDPLTGTANRRTLDSELDRACATAAAEGSPLVLAMLDLDHFKRYNDERGHQAGDQLLREATQVWSGWLLPGELLARYGGEEFALLFPGQSVAQVRPRLEQMLRHTPDGQTFSAGVAVWEPGLAPEAMVGAADRALYRAKAGGRCQIQIVDDSTNRELIDSMRMAFQPVVDLATGQRQGFEALARFRDLRPERAFEQARVQGFASELEAAAVRLARAHVPQGGGQLAVNASLGGLLGEPMQQALAGDLTGLIVEITENSTVPDVDAVAVVIDGLRSRGALIAVDDWPRGFSTMDRMLWLRPDILKIDVSVTRALDLAHHRAAVGVVVAWAAVVDASICAEGIETQEQWDQMRELGVGFGQGYLFGRPEVPNAPDAPGVREVPAEAPEPPARFRPSDAAALVTPSR